MRRHPLLLPILAAVLVARSLLVKFPLGHDALEYVVRQVEFHQSLHDGVLWPQWAPDLSNGFGQPLFVFSPPVFYWLAEPFVALGTPLHTALPLTVTLILVLSALSAYLLGRELWGAWGGSLCAVAHVTAPCVSLDVYVRAAWAELAAFPAYPVALWALLRLRRGGVRYLVPAAFALAWVAGSHHPALLLFAPTFAIVGLLLALHDRKLRLLGLTGAALILGLAIGAAFWLPSMAEMGFTHVDRLLENALAYRNHYVAPWQLLWSRWGHGVSLPGTGDGMSFRLGPALLGSAAVATILVWHNGRRGARRGHIAGLWLLAVGSALMATQLGGFVWDRIPLLQYIQFPWRILAVTTLFLTILAGGLAATRRRAAVAGLASLVLIGVALPRATMPEARRSIPFDDEYYSPARIARLEMTTTTREEFSPRTCLRLPRPLDADARWLSGGGGEIEEAARAPTRRSFKLSARAPGELLLPVLYFPGWSARIDGSDAGVRPEPVYGRIVVRVPEGEHTVDLHFGDTAIRSWARWISLASLAGAVLVLVLAGPRGGKGG